MSVREIAESVKSHQAAFMCVDCHQPWPLNVTCPVCNEPPRVWCYDDEREMRFIGMVHDERREAAAVAVTEPGEASRG